MRLTPSSFTHGSTVAFGAAVAGYTVVRLVTYVAPHLPGHLLAPHGPSFAGPAPGRVSEGPSRAGGHLRRSAAAAASLRAHPAAASRSRRHESPTQLGPAGPGGPVAATPTSDSTTGVVLPSTGSSAAPSDAPPAADLPRAATPAARRSGNARSTGRPTDPTSSAGPSEDATPSATPQPTGGARPTPTATLSPTGPPRTSSTPTPEPTSSSTPTGSGTPSPSEP